MDWHLQELQAQKISFGWAKSDVCGFSVPAVIGWTTVGHVGTDVDLHCMGPLVLERMCKGLHENTYINKIMTNYLNLGSRQQSETLRLRNLTTLEYWHVGQRERDCHLSAARTRVLSLSGAYWASRVRVVGVGEQISKIR